MNEQEFTKAHAKFFACNRKTIFLSPSERTQLQQYIDARREKITQVIPSPLGKIRKTNATEKKPKPPQKKIPKEVAIKTNVAEITLLYRVLTQSLTAAEELGAINSTQVYEAAAMFCLQHKEFHQYSVYLSRIVHDVLPQALIAASNKQAEEIQVLTSKYSKWLSQFLLYHMLISGNDNTIMNLMRSHYQRNHPFLSPSQRDSMLQPLMNVYASISIHDYHKLLIDLPKFASVYTTEEQTSIASKNASTTTCFEIFMDEALKMIRLSQWKRMAKSYMSLPSSFIAQALAFSDVDALQQWIIEQQSSTEGSTTFAHPAEIQTDSIVFKKLGGAGRPATSTTVK